MDFLYIVTRMLMIFGIVVVGFAASKRGLWAGDLDRKLSVFILNVSMPALVLASVMGEGLHFSGSDLLTMGYVSLLSYAMLIGVAWLLPLLLHTPRSRTGLMRFMLAFGNVSFIGFSVCDAVFGEEGVFCASVINIPFNLLIFTLGVAFIRGGSARSALALRQVLSPCLVASLVAVAIALTGWQPPRALGEWFHLLGDLTIPCALLIIGSSLSHIPVRDMLGNRFVYVVVTLRLLVLPMAVCGLLWLCGADPFVRNVAVVLSAMPVATNGIMFCLQYGGDERVMTQGLFISTLLSVATIPAIAFLLSLIG